MRIKTIYFLCFCSLFFISANLSAQDFNHDKPSLGVDELWQKSITELKGNLNLLLGENQELRQKEQALNNRISELESLLKESAAEKNNFSSVIAKYQEQLSLAAKQTEALQQEKTALEKQLADASGSLSQLNKKIDELEQSSNAKSLREELAKKNSQISKLESIVKEYGQDNFQLVNKLKQKETEIASLQAAAKGREKNLKERENSAGEIARLQEINLAFEKKISLLQSNLDSLNNEKLNLAKQVDVVKNDNESLNSEIARLNSSKIAADSEKKLALLENQIANLNSDKASLEKEINIVKRDLADKTKIIEDLNKKQEYSNRENAILESLLRISPQQPKSIINSKGKTNINHEVMAYNLAREGRLKEAVEEYRQAIAQDPKDKDLYYNLACIYSRLNDLNKAVENYKMVLQLDPKDKESLYNLSRVYESLNDDKNSRYYHEAYLKLN